MISEFLRLKEKIKNGTASPEEHRRYLSLLSKLENSGEDRVSERIKNFQKRWI